MTEPAKTLAPIICGINDVITIKDAVAETRLSEKTIRRYFKKFRLGRQTYSNAPLRISKPGLMMVVHGDFEALEQLRAGNRHHPSVLRYFDALGIPA